MAREWHPVEEFTTLMTVTGRVTAMSTSAKRDCYQHCDFILIFQRASKAGEVPAVRAD